MNNREAPTRSGIAYVAACVVVAGALCAFTLHMLQPITQTLPPALRLGLAGAAACVVLALCAAPLMILTRRGVERLCAQARSGEGDVHAVRVASWLGPVVSSVGELQRQWAERCAEQAARLRSTEIKLSVSEAERRHCEAVINGMRDAVIVTDAFNEISLLNRQACELLGLDPVQALHKPVASLVKDRALCELIEDVAKAGVAHKQKHVEHTVEGVEPSGDEPPPTFDVTLSSLNESAGIAGSGAGGGSVPAGAAGGGGHSGVPGQGSVSTGGGAGGVLTILRDVTREKEISRMKSDFVSQASHELRTPLSSIKAYVEMLIDSEEGDEKSRREFYTIIKAETDRVARLVDNMLNISRIEAGIVNAEAAEVDFAKLITEVAETMQPQAKVKRIMLTARSGPLIYTAQADRDMMHQVIVNLVSNAIKYTPEDGRVTVSVESDDATRSVMVTVADTGLGIPPDAIDRVFEKFYRIENYKRVAKGTGLGLNLVKQIVERVHKGRVGVTSQVGMGSKFWFTVPYEFQSS